MLFSCQHIHVILDKMPALAPQSDRDAATEPFAWHSGGAQARLRQVWASLLDDGEQRCLPPSICAAFVGFFACAIVDIASIPTHALARTVRRTASIPSAFAQLDLAPLNLDQLSADDPASSRELRKTRVHVKGQKDMPSLCLVLRAAAAALWCSVGVDAFRLPTLHVTSQRWAVCCPRIRAQSSHSEQSHSPLR